MNSAIVSKMQEQHYKPKKAHAILSLRRLTLTFFLMSSMNLKKRRIINLHKYLND